MLWLINLIFSLLIAVTILGSIWLSRKFKERFAEFPWWKVAVLIVVEVVAWVITYKILRNWWAIPILVIVMIIILMKKKKKKEQIL